MKGILQGNDLVGAAFVAGAPFAGKLDRAFIGLAPAVGEKHFLEAAVLDDALGEAYRRLVVESRAGRDQLARLVQQGLRYERRAMAQAIDCPALHEVEIALAFVIP